MTGPQTAKTNMFAATKATCDAHIATVTGFAPLNTAYGEFTALLETLDQFVGLQDTTSVGTTMAKAALRHTLEGQVMHASDTLVLHYKLTGNEQLRRDIYAPKSTLTILSERALIGHAQKVLSTAADITPATLTALGFAPADLTAATNNLNAFIAAIGKPRHIRAEAKRGTESLASVIDDLMEILIDDMDPAADVLQYSNPEFYSEYKTAREIVDLGSQTRELTVNITNGGELGISGVQALITPGNINKVSTQNGTFYIQNMDGGTYTMLLNHNSYAQKSVQFTIVDGQATVVDVVLDPTNP